MSREGTNRGFPTFALSVLLAAACQAAAVKSNGDRCQPDQGGWYYDTAPGAGAQPRRVILCPQSCARLRGDAGARVDLVFGCATRGID